MDPREQRRIINEYPTLLAATYAKKIAPYPAVGVEQAYQFHMSLRDLSEAIIKYLTVIALAQYRKQTLAGANENEQVERGLRELKRPSLGDWGSLLRSSLQLFDNTDEELLQKLYTYYFTKRHTDNEIGVAIEQVQDWLELSPRRKAPFAYKDLFDQLVPYRNDPRGWGAHGAILHSSEYVERIEVLRPALERALFDLRFLTDFTPIYVQSITRMHDGRHRHRLNIIIGRNPLPEVLDVPWTLESEHIYICRDTASGREPFLDVYPLLIAHDCVGCRDQAVYVVNWGDKGRLEYLSYSCGHDLTISEEQYKIDFRRFIFLEESQRASAGPQPSNPGEIMYRNMLREFLRAGEIDVARRGMLEQVTRGLALPHSAALQIELEVRAELAVRPSESSKPNDPQDMAEGDARRVTEDKLPETADVEVYDSEAVQSALPSPDMPAVYEVVTEADLPTDLPVETVAVVETLDVASTVDEVAPVDQNTESVTGDASIPVAELPLDEPATEESEPPQQLDSDVEPLVSRSDAHKLIACWSELSAAPVSQVAIAGAPPWLLVADESGCVLVYSIERGELLYRDQFDGRLFRIAALDDSVVIGTWDGGLYCYGRQGLLWQTNLRSPISALAVSKGKMRVVAGTWSGSVAAYDSNGDHFWDSRLQDGISSLAMHASGLEVAVGTYGGHISVLDSTGQKRWLWNMPAAVVGLLFDGSGQDILVLTQDRAITRINADLQQTVWDSFVEHSPAQIALSANNRRLVMLSRERRLSLFIVNGGLRLAKQPADIDDVSQVLISPASKDGLFVLALSLRDGLYFWDDRRAVVTQEATGATTCMTLSADGMYIALGTPNTVDVYRLAQPNLHVTLQPQEKMRRDRYSRIHVLIKNGGERLARDIEIELIGSVKYTPFHLPKPILGAGDVITLTQQSILPEVDGAVPVSIRLKYIDDLGISHSKDEMQMLDVE